VQLFQDNLQDVDIRIDDLYSVDLVDNEWEMLIAGLQEESIDCVIDAILQCNGR